MTDTKFGLKFLIGIAVATGIALVAGCGGPEKVTRTTTTEQSTTTMPMAPTTSTTTTTTNTQQSQP